VIRRLLCAIGWHRYGSWYDGVGTRQHRMCMDCITKQTRTTEGRADGE
jgi:hypothetical protein